MGLANSDFPASEAFDAINQGMIDEPAEKKDAIKKAAAVFAFTLKNKAGKQESWYIDLKNDGTVGKGAAPPSGKADGMYISSLERVMRNYSLWERKQGDRGRANRFYWQSPSLLDLIASLNLLVPRQPLEYDKHKELS